MTVDERKMTIAYADLLNIQELVQHILRMDADELFKPETRKTFAQIAFQLDTVMADVGHYVSSHTDFNENKQNEGELFSPELPVDQVLKIGRDFQNQDRWRGAHYDTARLLCDTIERLNQKLKEKES